MVRYALAALALDAALVGAGLAWSLYLGPARKMARFLGTTDQAQPAFVLDRGTYLPIPTATNAYFLAEFVLPDSAAWEITGAVPPGARYFSVTLYGTRGRSYVPRPNRRITLNDEDLVYDDPAARTFRIYLSAVNPGHPNWLDCSAGPHGLVIVRANGVAPEQAVAPRLRTLPPT